MSRRFPSLNELLASTDDLQHARTQAAAPGQDQAIGSTIGGIAGAVGGAALAFIPGVGPALAIPAMGAGSALGSAVAGAVGNQVGSTQADDAQAALAARDAFRQRALANMQARKQALDELLSQG